MDRIDKDEELVCPLCGGRLFWMPVSLIYACEHCKQSFSQGSGIYLRKKCKLTTEKSSVVGNAAAMREALSEIVLLTVKAGRSISCDVACGIIASKAKHALKQPPRNCDRYATLPDALAAWRDVDPREAGPFDLWLFAPATEGGAK